MDYEHKPLHRRIDFRASIGIPIALGLVVAALIYINEGGLSACFTASCFIYAWDTFKAPLAISAISIPLASLVSSYHRSIETNMQIALTIKNNTFSNYMSHRSDFVEGFKSFGGRVFYIGDVERLYHRIFPKNSFSYFSPELESPELNLQGHPLNEAIKYLAQASEAVKNHSPGNSIEPFIINMVEAYRTVGVRGIGDHNFRFNDHDSLNSICYNSANPLAFVISLSSSLRALAGYVFMSVDVIDECESVVIDFILENYAILDSYLNERRVIFQSEQSDPAKHDDIQ